MGKVSGGHIPACLGKGWGEEGGSLGGRCSVCEVDKVERKRTSHQRQLEAKDKARSGHPKECVLCCLPLDMYGRKKTLFMREFLRKLSYG